jgi:hypothetical protein
MRPDSIAVRGDAAVRPHADPARGPIPRAARSRGRPAYRSAVVRSTMINSTYLGIMRVILVKLIIVCVGYGVGGGWKSSPSVSPPRRKVNRARSALSWLMSDAAWAVRQYKPRRPVGSTPRSRLVDRVRTTMTSDTTAPIGPTAMARLAAVGDLHLNVAGRPIPSGAAAPSPPRRRAAARRRPHRGRSWVGLCLGGRLPTSTPNLLSCRAWVAPRRSRAR